MLAARDGLAVKAIYRFRFEAKNDRASLADLAGVPPPSVVPKDGLSVESQTMAWNAVGEGRWARAEAVVEIHGAAEIADLVDLSTAFRRFEVAQECEVWKLVAFSIDIVNVAHGSVRFDGPRLFEPSS